MSQAGPESDLINGAAVNKKVIVLVNYRLVLFMIKMTKISPYPFFLVENKMTIS